MENQEVAVEKIKELLIEHFEADDAKVSKWLSSDNPGLGGSSPNILIEKGRANKVLMYVEALCNGY